MGETQENKLSPTPGRVIKDASAIAPMYPETRLLKPAVLEAEKVLQRARHTEQAAKTESERLIRAAEQEAQAIRIKAAAQATEEIRSQMEGILRRLDESIQQHRQEFTQFLPRGAMQLAKAIVRAEMTTNPAHLIRIVEDCANQAKRYEMLTIRLHPTDAGIVNAQISALRETLSFAKQVEVVADATVPRFEVRIDTEMGRYIDGLETAVKRLEAHLLGESGEENLK